ncbi:MAG: hypothetical protein ACO201_06235 [Rickettsiales bacterium]
MTEEKMPLYLFKFGEYKYMKKLYEEGELFFNTYETFRLYLSLLNYILPYLT